MQIGLDKNILQTGRSILAARGPMGINQLSRLLFWLRLATAQGNTILFNSDADIRSNEIIHEEKHE